MKVEYPMDEKV